MAHQERPRIAFRGRSLPTGEAFPTREHLILTPNEEMISDPADVDGLTRKVLRYGVAPNQHDEYARVRATIVHQRRSPTAKKNSNEWMDCESVPLSKMHADHLVRMGLSGRETKRLFAALYRLYKDVGTIDGILGELGHIAIPTPMGGSAAQLRQVLTEWTTQEGTGFFEMVEQLRPDLFETVLMLKAREDKRRALAEFEREMNRSLLQEGGVWAEPDWQRYFAANTWIFGFGLSYHFLNSVQNQPHLGGTEVSGRGAQRGDYLLRTEADVRFTVLVDIKRPDSPLLVPAAYRGDGTHSAVYRPAKDLAGGIAQIQLNCETWMRTGSQQSDARDQEVLERVLTHEPKGILVIGHLGEFVDERKHADRAKASSFERLRRNTHNPEILTFDELFARASYLAEKQFESIEAIQPVDEDGGW